MDNEELEALLREWVAAAVSIADNVESIARVIERAEEREVHDGRCR